jgi:polar amino acid transport system substrate-binding protein
VLGQADAMSADYRSPSAITEQRQARAGGRDSIGAVRLVGEEGIATAQSPLQALQHLMDSGTYKTIATNWGVENGRSTSPDQRRDQPVSGAIS